MKKIILIVIFLVGFYYIFSNLNNEHVNSNIILINVESNISESTIKKIDLEKEFNSSKNVEFKSTNIGTFEESNFSEEIDNINIDQDELYNNKDIENSDLYYLDEEDFEIEINLNLSNFFYDFSEKENLNIDDFEDVLKY